MKSILTSLILMLSLASQAQEFKFVPPGAKNSKILFTAEASDSLKAAKIAAEKCFDFFTQGKGVSDDYGIDVINLCANLRQK